VHRFNNINRGSIRTKEGGLEVCLLDFKMLLTKKMNYKNVLEFIDFSLFPLKFAF